MNVKIIGTGNMAWFVALRLFQAGHRIHTIYGRDRTRTLHLANRVKARAETEIKDLEESDLCFLAVSDSAIEELAANLAFQNTLLVHHSGTVPLNTLAPCSPHRGVLWPMLSIHPDSLPQEEEFPIAWEASNPESAETLKSLVADLGGTPWESSGSQRASLHLSAVLSQNFLAYMLAEARQFCVDRNLPFSLLSALVRQTVDQAFSPSGLEGKITGPAIRRDQITLERHRKMLHDHPRLAKLYDQITESIQEAHNRRSESQQNPDSL